MIENELVLSGEFDHVAMSERLRPSETSESLRDTEVELFEFRIPPPCERFV